MEKNQKIIHLKQKKNVTSLSQITKDTIRTGTLEYSKEVLKKLNIILKENPDLPPEQIKNIKRLRQNAYDRLRCEKNPISKLDTVQENLEDQKTLIFKEEIKNSKSGIPNMKQINPKEQSFTFENPKIPNWIKNIELGKAVSFLFYFSILGFCLVLIYSQSVPIYKAIGFPNPKLSTMGALFLLLSFPALHAIKKSNFLLLFCLFLSCYEVSLIYKGTFIEDVSLKNLSIEKSTSVSIQEEDLLRKKEIYEEKKSLYENSESNVFHNAWFKKVQLNPAWDNVISSEKKLEEMKQIETKKNNYSVSNSILKIIFRFFLVALTMISIHRFIGTSKQLMLR